MLGGFLAEWYGIHAPFFAVSGVLAASSVALAVSCPETLRRGSVAAQKKSAGLLEQWRTLGAKRELRGLFSCSFYNGLREGGAAVTTMLFMCRRDSNSRSPDRARPAC